MILVQCSLIFFFFFGGGCYNYSYIYKKDHALYITSVYLRKIIDFFFSPVLHQNVSCVSITALLVNDIYI